MSLLQFGGLFVVWLISVVFIGLLTYQEFRRIRFNFNVFFSFLYLLTFFFGFPFTCILAFRFEVAVVSAEVLLQAQLAATCFYGIYYVAYKTRLRKQRETRMRPPLFTMSRVETHLLWILLAVVALASVAVFFIQNGFLLFKLNSHQRSISH